MKRDNNNVKSGEASSIMKMLLKIEKKIDRIDTKANLDKDYLTTHEACLFLGCSRGMIWKMVKAGKLNRLKLENGRTYYATAELRKIIETPIIDN